jgi:hypothetical protein
MEDRNYKVYMHTVPNGKKYIGITKQNVKERWRNGRGYENNKRFYNAILKYGWENIQHDILLTDLTQEEAYEKEIELIALNETNNPNYGYNQTDGGANANYAMFKPQPMPPFEEVYNNAFMLEMFNILVKSCDYNKVIETTKITTIDKNGNETIEVIEKERVIEPDLIAINIILDNYSNVEMLQPLIKKLKIIKEKLDD